ncbi:MAG: carbamoyltransferase HypF [Candidatus Binataceae bacterium]
MRIGGIVQGVGFRPFVHSLATRIGLSGFVTNDTQGVLIEAEGDVALVARFVESLRAEAPPLAIIERIEQEQAAISGMEGFAIVESRNDGERRALISPDIASCAECIREMFDPADRRYLYPFTNCTNCGPRFTIVRNIPYDRPLTTMAGFAMCPDCSREYHDPSDRRFHAQPISCPACGPRLRLIGRDGAELAGDPIAITAALMSAGHIVAIKGLGGYHLAAAAEDDLAVGALRARKHREDKPFAVMCPDIAAARRLAAFDSAEERILAGPRRPIVLARRRPDASVAESVAGANRYLGLMLPYTPLHHLLCHDFRAPFVLTSGNVSDEPIAYHDEDAFPRLSQIADFFLTHDRPIHIRTDDSVVRVFRGREIAMRRARGYAPQPLSLSFNVPRPTLGCGAELKNTFCLAKERHAFVSHHIGDLENYETLRAFTDGVEHFRRLFDITPEIVACDLHPEYLSTKHALELEGVELMRVQHHHAHIAACLADNGEDGPAIGVAFDGLGYGTDGTMWGGEFLIADLTNFERVASLEPIPMPGGAAAIRQPWRMAAAYLDAIYGDKMPGGIEVARRNQHNWRPVVRMARARLNSPLTSSVGRLFDAVAAILGLRDTVNYEGQAAIELEQRASPIERAAYRVAIRDGNPRLIQATEIVQAVLEDLRLGRSVETIAARFHNTIARLIADICEMARASRGFSTVALSGGVFQNLFLLERTAGLLRQQGFRVLTHNRVPANDGGISLGQVVVAAARDRAGRI